jgi:hypothetical protein
MINQKILKQLIEKDFDEVVDLEHKFHPTRKWRIDCALPERMLAIEIEGGVFTQGRHTRGKGFINDIEKYNALTTLGWHLLRYTHHHTYTHIMTDLKKFLYL